MMYARKKDCIGGCEGLYLFNGIFNGMHGRSFTLEDLSINSNMLKVGTCLENE